MNTESLVPAEHLLRKIDAAVDFNKIHGMVELLYCSDSGCSSVDSVVLYKEEEIFYKIALFVCAGQFSWAALR